MDLAHYAACTWAAEGEASFALKAETFHQNRVIYWPWNPKADHLALLQMKNSSLPMIFDCPTETKY